MDVSSDLPKLLEQVRTKYIIFPDLAITPGGITLCLKYVPIRQNGRAGAGLTFNEVKG